MELLAPAGTIENFMAALEAGADAIFLGGKAFGARSKVANFGYEELRAAVRIAHLLGVAIHVTVNILVGDQELKELKHYLMELEELGIDAIIVQDLAVAQIAKEVAPHLELHASTQLTVTNLGTIRFLEEMGFSRIVLARELSLEEIRKIKKNTSLEIEMFIHGALCICYSGQCLMSSFIGGRSGNRGACAQPCRLPYELLDNKDNIQTKKNENYLLSPKDLNYSEYIGELLKIGIDSFKVEGRMKKVSYVKQVIGTYREIINEQGHMDARSKDNLAAGFNRGFSTAYLENRVGREMMTIVAPNNQGKKVGLAKMGKNNVCDLELVEELPKGGLLKVISPTGQVIYISIDEQWKRVDRFHFKGTPSEGRVEGDVYLVSTSKSSEGYRGLANFTRKYPIYAYLDGVVGEPVSLTLLMENGISVTVTNDYILQIAQKRATSKEKIEEQLNRLGNTVFTLQSVNLPTGDYMWPMSVLNELRRDAVAKLEEVLLKEYEEKRLAKLRIHQKHLEELKENKSYPILHKHVISEKARNLYNNSFVTARVDELWQIPVAVQSGAKKIIFGGDRLQRTPYSLEDYSKAVQYGKDLGVYLTIAMPRIIREIESDTYQKQLRHIVSLNPDAIAINFLGGYTWLRELNYLGDIEGDTSLHTFNSLSLEFLASLGLSAIAVSQEATLQQIHRMHTTVPILLESVVQGNTELMVSEYCVIGSFLGNGTKINCPKPCTTKQYFLKDRKGEKFPLRTDPYCRMHIMNSRDLDLSPYIQKIVHSGVTSLRIDVRQCNQDYIKDKVRLYTGLLSGQIAIPDKSSDHSKSITRGHYFKGIFEV